MRITTLLILVSVMCVYADQAYTQNARVSISRTNVMLEDILSEIESQTDYLFIYNNEVATNQKVSVQAENRQVAGLLNEILDALKIGYRMEGMHIILHNSDTLLPQQERNTIRGRVVDLYGEPIIGGNVYEKNTTNGVITDIEGHFSIDVPLHSVIVVSYIGYITFETNVGTNKSIEIILEEDTKNLEEVVVVGYGVQKKSNLTGAVSSVSSDVLEDRPITSVGAGLQGVIPNLNITFDNGAPGQGAKFNVRGTTNFNESGALVLVDGIEMDPNFLNPSDIKEVTVLKDAASAAIYGARAAFGVVLITTKTGFINRKPQITFEANYAFNTPTVKPRSMNSLEYTQWMNDANMTTNGSNYFDDITMEHVRNYFNDPHNNLPVFNHPDDAAGVWRYCGNTDWYKTLNKTGYPTQKYNVSIVGGTKDVSYYASAGYFNQKGLSRWAQEDYDRYNIMQNVRYKVADWIEIGLNTSLAITDQTTGGANLGGTSALNVLLAADTRPLMPLYHPDGNFSGNCGEGYFTNTAAWQSQGGNGHYRNNEVLATGLLKLTPFTGLTINMDYSLKYYNYTFKNYRREYNDYDAAGNWVVFPHTTPNAVSYNKDESQNNILNIYTTYEKKINRIHDFKIMGGFNQESYIIKTVGLSRANLISNEIPFLSQASGDRTTSDSQDEFTIRGAFFRFNYALLDKYLFEINGRYDGSSRFPKDDRFAFFPSFSAGWKVSEEKFWQPIRTYMNTFKLRGSYGSLGNQMVSGYYPYILSYNSSEINYLFNGIKEMAVSAPGLVSDMLTWEKVTSWDLGFDFGLFDNRLTGSFDFYQRDTKDMLTKSKTLPAILGTDEPEMNAADLRNRGWEMEMSWKHRLQNGFNYQLTATLSDYKAWITKYDNPTKSLSDNYYEGMRLGEIWGFVTDGFFKTDEEAANWDQSELAGYTQYAGDLKFADLDGNGKVDYGSRTVDDPGDRKIIGNNTPRYNFSLTGFAAWKGIDLTLFFQGTLKRDIISNTSFYLDHYRSQWQVPQKMNYDYWREDNPDAFFPRARLNGSAVAINQTHFLQNAAFIRLKRFSLGYTLPSEIVNKAKISKVRLYFDANNLWEHSKMKDGFDPELPQVNSYPLMRSYSFGANITF